MIADWPVDRWTFSTDGRAVSNIWIISPLSHKMRQSPVILNASERDFRPTIFKRQHQSLDRFLLLLYHVLLRLARKRILWRITKTPTGGSFRNFVWMRERLSFHDWSDFFQAEYFALFFIFYFFIFLSSSSSSSSSPSSSSSSSSSL